MADQHIPDAAAASSSGAVNALDVKGIAEGIKRKNEEEAATEAKRRKVPENDTEMLSPSKLADPANESTNADSNILQEASAASGSAAAGQKIVAVSTDANDFQSVVSGEESAVDEEWWKDVKVGGPCIYNNEDWEGGEDGNWTTKDWEDWLAYNKQWGDLEWNYDGYKGYTSQEWKKHWKDRIRDHNLWVGSVDAEAPLRKGQTPALRPQAPPASGAGQYGHGIWKDMKWDHDAYEWVNTKLRVKIIGKKPVKPCVIPSKPLPTVNPKHAENVETWRPLPDDPTGVDVYGLKDFDLSKSVKNSKPYLKHEIPKSWPPGQTKFAQTSNGLPIPHSVTPFHLNNLAKFMPKDAAPHFTFYPSEKHEGMKNYYTLNNEKMKKEDKYRDSVRVESLKNRRTAVERHLKNRRKIMAKRCQIDHDDDIPWFGSQRSPNCPPQVWPQFETQAAKMVLPVDPEDIRAQLNPLERTQENKSRDKWFEHTKNESYMTKRDVTGLISKLAEEGCKAAECLYMFFEDLKKQFPDVQKYMTGKEVEELYLDIFLFSYDWSDEDAVAFNKWQIQMLGVWVPLLLRQNSFHYNPTNCQENIQWIGPRERNNKFVDYPKEKRLRFIIEILKLIVPYRAVYEQCVEGYATAMSWVQQHTNAGMCPAPSSFRLVRDEMALRSYTDIWHFSCVGQYQLKDKTEACMRAGLPIPADLSDSVTLTHRQCAMLRLPTASDEKIKEECGMEWMTIQEARTVMKLLNTGEHSFDSDTDFAQTVSCSLPDTLRYLSTSRLGFRSLKHLIKACCRKEVLNGQLQLKQDAPFKFFKHDKSQKKYTDDINDSDVETDEDIGPPYKYHHYWG